MSIHKTFEEFLRCIDNRTYTAFRAAGKKWPVTKTWIRLNELTTADGMRPVKEVWDNLPYFYRRGRDEIQKTLQEEWKNHFAEDRSKLVAKGIESCIIDHGDRSDFFAKNTQIVMNQTPKTNLRPKSEWRS